MVPNSAGKARRDGTIILVVRMMLVDDELFYLWCRCRVVLLRIGTYLLGGVVKPTRAAVDNVAAMNDGS